MEHRTTHFEEHLAIVEGGHQKVAGAKVTGKENDSLLSKLAAELGMDKEKKTDEAQTGKAHEAAEAKAGEAAPTAEGQKELAGEDIAAASSEVSAATDGVVVPQLIAAGGNPVEAAAKMAPKIVAPTGESPAIATGEGTATDAANMHKTPEAVAAASRGAGGAQAGKLESAATATPVLNEEKTAAEATKIGEIIAKAFQSTLEKVAADQEYTEALTFLTDKGLLEGFQIKDAGITKTSSYKPGALEKIANKQLLSREDIVNAAAEYVQLEKDAEEADAQGRQDAHDFIDLLASMEKTGEEKPAAGTEDQEKIAELLKDETVVNAIKVLKAKDLL